jgi:hypothetical protein
VATGQTSKPINDWQTVDASDWENVSDTPAPSPIMRAASRPDNPVRNWLEDVGNDLRQGGKRTVVGRTLGEMQGRKDRGYSGLQAGVSKATAELMGSPELGAVETLQGVANMKEHPVKGTWDAIKGIAHMTEVPGMMAGAPASETIAEATPTVVRKVLEKLPTATRGAKRLNEVEEVAGKLPVELNRAHDELVRAKQLSDAGFYAPAPIKKLLKRYASAQRGGKIITYSEARDFYSALSSSSATESMAIKPPMRRQLGLIVEGLRGDIGDTAAMVGKDSQYFSGIQDYARAMKARRIANAIGGALKSKALKYAAGAGAGYAAAKAIEKEIK